MFDVDTMVVSAVLSSLPLPGNATVPDKFKSPGSKVNTVARVSVLLIVTLKVVSPPDDEPVASLASLSSNSAKAVTENVNLVASFTLASTTNPVSELEAVDPSPAVLSWSSLASATEVPEVAFPVV